MSLPNVIPTKCEKCGKESTVITRSKKNEKWICLNCFREEDSIILEDFKYTKEKMERTDKSVDITDDMIYDNDL